MTGSPSPSPVRLFVALDLPDDACRALAAWQAQVLACEPALRMVAPSSLHVTLSFLGPQSPHRVAAIAAIMNDHAASVSGLALGGASWRPRSHPRLLAVELIDGAGSLGAVQGRMAGALQDAGVARREARAFWPHVTVARVRRGASVDVRRALAAPASIAFAGAALTLYRSHPRPAGAVYEALAHTPL